MTLRELYRELRAAGLGRVSAWRVARHARALLGEVGA